MLHKTPSCIVAEPASSLFSLLRRSWQPYLSPIANRVVNEGTLLTFAAQIALALDRAVEARSLRVRNRQLNAEKAVGRPIVGVRPPVVVGRPFFPNHSHVVIGGAGVLGGGAVSCHNVGQPGRNIVRVRFASGRDLVLMVAEKEWMRAGYQINLYGTKGWRTLTPNLADLYWYLLERFLALVRTKKESVPIEEEVEVIAVLEAGKRSLAEKREVTVAEVLQ